MEPAIMSALTVYQLVVLAMIIIMGFGGIRYFRKEIDRIDAMGKGGSDTKGVGIESP